MYCSYMITAVQGLWVHHAHYTSWSWSPDLVYLILVLREDFLAFDAASPNTGFSQCGKKCYHYSIDTLTRGRHFMSHHEGPVTPVLSRMQLLLDATRTLEISTIGRRSAECRNCKLLLARRSESSPLLGTLVFEHHNAPNNHQQLSHI